MSEDWDITEEGTLMIRQNTVYDLKQLYKLFHIFAEENNYKFIEKNFTRKDRNDGSEYQIEWRLERKVTDFIKFTIDIEIWSLRTVEIKKDNKSMFKGELEMNFDSVMIMDYPDDQGKSRWESNALVKFLRNIYIYYIKKEYFQGYAGKLWGDLYDLHGKVKARLNQFTA